MEMTKRQIRAMVGSNLILRDEVKEAFVADRVGYTISLTVLRTTIKSDISFGPIVTVWVLSPDGGERIASVSFQFSYSSFKVEVQDPLSYSVRVDGNDVLVVERYRD